MKAILSNTAIIAIFALMAIGLSALWHGQDGNVITAVIAGIAGLAGLTHSRY